MFINGLARDVLTLVNFGLTISYIFVRTVSFWVGRSSRRRDEVAKKYFSITLQLISCVLYITLRNIKIYWTYVFNYLFKGNI